MQRDRGSLTVLHLDDPDVIAGYEVPLVLIRPDQIVAWRGNSPAEPERVLRQVTGHQ